jgi:hypothetical protein
MGSILFEHDRPLPESKLKGLPFGKIFQLRLNSAELYKESWSGRREERRLGS